MPETMKVPVITAEAAEKAMQSAVSLMRQSLEEAGINVAWLARRLKRDLHRKETRTFKIKGRLVDLEAWTEEMAAKIQGGEPPKRRRPKAYRVLAQSAEEALVAVNFDCLDVQVRAREDAQKLLGLYRERLELSGPGGGPIPYDDIPQDERELLLAVTKDYERRLNEKNAKRGKKAGRKGRRTRQD